MEVSHLKYIYGRLIDLQQAHDSLLVALVTKGVITQADLGAAEALVKPVHDAAREGLAGTFEGNAAAVDAALSKIDRSGEGSVMRSTSADPDGNEK